MALPVPSSRGWWRQPDKDEVGGSSPAHRNWPAEAFGSLSHHSHDFTWIDHGPAGSARLRVRRAEIPAVKLHKQRTLQTYRHAMLALDVSQINWRTTVAHLPTEDIVGSQ